MDRTHCIGNAVQPIIAHYLFECIKGFDKQLA
nr:MAG TPA: DNA methylase [Caudoviricetes sp.]